ncbi:MAG: zinc ABC transporter substrate-binding protein [Verrucomicrobiota bacterium]
MKTIRGLFALIFAGFLTVSCDSPNDQAEVPSDSKAGKPILFASLSPVGGVLEKLTGDLADVQVLVGEGQDPHEFTPTTGQLASLGSAKAIFLSGMPFEIPLGERLKESGADIQVIDLSGGEGHDSHGEEDGEHVGCLHSHLWLSPLDLTTMVETAKEQLLKMFPDNEEKLLANIDAYLSELETLHEEIGSKMKPLEGKAFYTYHAAFDAFACAYDLDERPVEVEGKTPTPAELAKFLKDARETGANALIIQPQFDTKSAEDVAKELELKTVSIDPMERDPIDNIRKIAEAIKFSVGS